MADKKSGGGDLALIFGGGSDAAPGGSSGDAESEPRDTDMDALAGELSGDDTDEDSAPPDFATHALEAFPELDEPRIQALYRMVKSCQGM